MKLATVAATAAAISTASAMGDLAFNLGVKNNDGTCKQHDDYMADFAALAPYTNTVKFYAVSDCNTLQIIGPAAEAAGFTLFAGVWPTDDSHFQLEQQALQQYLPWIKKSTIKGILVGSEALYRADLTAEQLSNDINTVRSLLSNIKDSQGNSYSGVPVGTVDSWNVLVDGANAAVIESSDMVFANAFSYWQGQTMQNASYSFFDDIMQAMQTIQSTKGSSDITFYVGETGWPTDGTNFESSEPSLQNAQEFWETGVCAMRAWGVNVVAFEAFDEDWKPNTSGTSDVEKHWGIWDGERNLKYNLGCDFSK